MCHSLTVDSYLGRIPKGREPSLSIMSIMVHGRRSMDPKQAWMCVCVILIVSVRAGPGIGHSCMQCGAKLADRKLENSVWAYHTNSSSIEIE
jgi:hypothetical protein